ncbi:unnamed protein product [Linum trigynum]|uniref:Uncharacterized protein n=1 Tax=Linum trigynum TaxID=586398 RepID=A0AAV2F5D7_9ROSI
MAAQCVVREGIRWRIGDGKQIGIWWDKWIPEGPDYKVKTQMDGLNWDARVESLIDEETRTWKSSLLQRHFQPKDCKRIIHIPLSRHPFEDTRVWGPEKQRGYSVKSAYYLWGEMRL